MANLCRTIIKNTPSKIITVFEGVNKTHRKMKRIEVFEITQMFVYLAAYNYFYTTSMAAFKWENYLFCSLPILIESLPNYLFYFLVRKVLCYRIYNKYLATFITLLSYTLIALLAFYYFSRILPEDESVKKALSEASIYAPFFILPFLVMECIFEKRRNIRL